MGLSQYGIVFLATMHFKQRKRKLSNTLKRSLFKMHNKKELKSLLRQPHVSLTSFQYLQRCFTQVENTICVFVLPKR